VSRRRVPSSTSGTRIDAELLFHAEDGVEIQFLHEGIVAYARRWPLRAQAVKEGDTQRQRLMAEGWMVLTPGRQSVIGVSAAATLSG